MGLKRSSRLKIMRDDERVIWPENRQDMSMLCKPHNRYVYICFWYVYDGVWIRRYTGWPSDILYPKHQIGHI